ncbi:type IV pilus modification protein PilV [Thermomonas brevis]
MKHRSRQFSAPGKAQGMSLIEVLVAVLVLAVGLLGIAAMQALALRGGQGSLESSQAVMAANSIIEAMRANRNNAASYVYNGIAACGNVPAAAADLASNDLNNWATQLKETIGSGVGADTTTCGSISVVGGLYRVTVQWDDRRAGGSQTRTVVTEARI